MVIYFHADGSHTVSRAEDRSLAHDSVRVVSIRDDGSIMLLKDRYTSTAGRRTVLLHPLPLSRVHA